VEGEVAWRLVSTACALQGGWSPAGQFAHATTPFPGSIRPALRAGDHAHGPGYRAVFFSSPPDRHRGTPRARSPYGQRGARAHGTAGRALPPAADVTRPQSCDARKTARASSTHAGSPLQSLCELLARGPLWQSLVVASGHLL
jgi:hypothetical protein